MVAVLAELLAGVHTLCTISIVLAVFATLSVLLRVYGRAYIMRRFGADDWAMLLSWVGRKIAGDACGMG